MDQELQQMIREKYAALPENMKAALRSLPLQQLIQEIATQNGLHIDQTGDLYTETMLVMLGAEKIGNFEDNIRKTLGLDFKTATAVTQAVNDKILMSVRDSLRGMESVEESSPKSATPVAEANLQRQDILSEIENPTPTVHPISVADQTIPGPAAAKEVVPDLVANKLIGTVTIPSQTIQIPAHLPGNSPTKPPQPTPQQAPKPKNYSADPYREPLM